MTEYQGVITRVIEKPFGNKTMFSFAINTTDGLFGTGEKRPPAQGTSISFEASPNAKGFLAVVPKSIKQLADGQVSAATVAVASRATGPIKSDFQLREKYWGDKEQRDIRNDSLRELGASRNTALAIISLMVANEAVKLPAGPKREGFLWELIDKYTNKLMAKEAVETAPATNKDAAEAETADDAETEDWN